MTGADAHKLLDELRYELTVCQAKVTDLKRMLAGMNLPEDGPQFRCPYPTCGMAFKTKRRLDEHSHNVHPQPVAGRSVG